MRRALALLCVFGLLTACSSDGKPAAAANEVRADVPRAGADASAVDPTAASLHEFAVDLYRAVRGAGADNLVLSPYSVAVALAMARAGATGATASEIDAVLHTADGARFLSGLNAIDQALASRAGTFGRDDGSKDSIELDLANALFAQKGTTFGQPFLDTLASQLDAGMQVVDYQHDTEGARRQINDWVAQQTHDRIQDLVPQGVLDALTRLVAVNAIYLNAGWKFPFDEKATVAQPFHLLDGSTVDAPSMALSEAVQYGRGPGWQVVELPYIDEKLVMDVIVPDAGTFTTFDDQFDAATLAEVLAALAPGSVDLKLPKFEFTSSRQLGQPLQQLGMTTPFDPGRADFNGITTDEQIYLKDVVHKAFIKVNEKGTEAAAATADVFEATALPITQPLTVDRPFLFVIRDLPTNTPLFIGRVTNPTVG